MSQVLNIETEKITDTEIEIYPDPLEISEPPEEPKVEEEIIPIDHPSDPALIPVSKKIPLSQYFSLSVEEMAEKGKILARKLVEIDSKKSERSVINAEIKEMEDEAVKIRNALISGTVEVLTAQEDLFRQPVGSEAAAATFTEMARDAEQASTLPAEAITEVDALNAMAADIQADAGITEPSESFLNDIENFKAKSAKKRNGRNK